MKSLLTSICVLGLCIAWLWVCVGTLCSQTGFIDVSGWVYSLAIQADGKIVAGGNFSTSIGENICRMNADGSLDRTFKATVNDDVTAVAMQADGKIIIGGYFTIVNGAARSYLARLNPDGTTDTTFNPTPNREVFAVLVQADGKILIGGQFETIGGVDRYYLARLSATGALDALNPDPDWFVHALALQPDGKILVGGEFSYMGATPRSCIARLSSAGALDTTFNPGATNGYYPVVTALAVQADGKILVGGGFTMLGGLARTNIGRLNTNGTTDVTFSPGADYPPYAFSVRTDGKILVGGDFFTIGGVSVTGKAQLNADGTVDDPLTNIPTGRVFATAIDPAGRSLFGSVQGLYRLDSAGASTNALSYTGTTVTWSRSGAGPEVWWTTLDHTADGVSWTTIGTGTRIADGWQRTGVTLPAGRTLRARGQMAGDSHGSGWYVPAYYGKPFFITQPKGSTNDYLNDVRIAAFVGGSEPINYWWLKDGLIATNLPNASGYSSNALSLDNATKAVQGAYRLVASNSFGSVTSIVANLMVQEPGNAYAGPLSINASVGESAAFFGGAAGTPPLTYQWLNNGVPLAGATSASLTLSNLSVGNAGTISLVATNIYGSVTSPPALLTVNAASTDAAFSGTANSSIYATAVQGDGKILMGGNFTTFKGQSRLRMARIYPDGTLDTNFTAAVSNGYVNSLTLQSDGKILVGGDFTSLRGGARTNLARLNADGTIDSTFNAVAGPPLGSVTTLAIQTDGKILVGGNFDQLAGLTRYSIGRLNTNGTLDTTFNASVEAFFPWVYTLAVQTDGKILVGGAFDFLNGVQRFNIGRLNANGTLDNTFNPNANSFVWALAVQADGKILAGGTFNYMGNQPSLALARLNSTGTVDTNFNADMSGNFGDSVVVNSIALQVDGRILLGGSFRYLSGLSRNYFGRLNTNGMPDTTFNVGFSAAVRGVTVQPDGAVLVTHSGIYRVKNTAPAVETLNYTGTTIDWLRSGTGPEVSHAMFEYSTNGTKWTSLGFGTRLTNGWRKTAVPAQPASGILRARGWVRGADSTGSGWFTEKLLYRGKPVILMQPQSRTNLAGTAAWFSVQAEGTGALSYRWRSNGVFLAGGGKWTGTSSNLLTVSVAQLEDAAAYDVIVTNLSGSVTSSVANLAVLMLDGYNSLVAQLLGGGSLQLRYVGMPGNGYVLDRTFNLTPPVNWAPQRTNLAGGDGILLFTNTPIASTNNFWRVRSWP